MLIVKLVLAAVQVTSKTKTEKTPANNVNLELSNRTLDNNRVLTALLVLT